MASLLSCLRGKTRETLGRGAGLRPWIAVARWRTVQNGAYIRLWPKGIVSLARATLDSASYKRVIDRNCREGLSGATTD